MRLTRSQLRSIKNILASTFCLTDTQKASLDKKLGETVGWMCAIDSQNLRDINAATRKIARLVGSLASSLDMSYGTLARIESLSDQNLEDLECAISLERERRATWCTECMSHECQQH